MKVMLYPGAFNPATIGHMRLLKAAMQTLLPNMSLLLPMYKSAEGEGAPIHLRKRMIVASIGEFLPPEMGSMADVDWYEPKQSAQSMLEAVRHYKENYPGGDLWVLMGDAGARESLKWAGTKELAQSVRIAMPYGVDPLLLTKVRRRGFQVSPIPHQPSTITSAEARASVATNKTSRHLCKTALSVIRENGLYGAKKPLGAFK